LSLQCSLLVPAIEDATRGDSPSVYASNVNAVVEPRTANHVDDIANLLDRPGAVLAERAACQYFSDLLVTHGGTP
jgi:hypothetical protein